MTEARHRTAIVPQEWSLAKPDIIRMRGPLSLTVAGQWGLVEVDLRPLPPEDLYAFARTFRRWAERLEVRAVAAIEEEAQAPLPGM